MKGENVTHRISTSMMRLALVALLAAGCSLQPGTVKAQAQTTASEASVAPGAAAKPESAAPQEAQKDSDEEQTNAFRTEGAIVKATAKALNLSPEVTARGFELINFAVIFFAIVIPLVRFLPKVFRRRGETVRRKIEEARTATADANSRLSAIESKLSGLDAEIARLRTQAEEDGRKDEERIKASIGEERDRIVASAEQEIAAATAHAQRELRNFAADLAIGQAASSLKLSTEADQALIAEFLEAAGKGGN